MKIGVETGLLERLEDFVNLIAEMSESGARGEHKNLTLYHWREAVDLAIKLEEVRKNFDDGSPVPGSPHAGAGAIPMPASSDDAAAEAERLAGYPDNESDPQIKSEDQNK